MYIQGSLNIYLNYIFTLFSPIYKKQVKKFIALAAKSLKFEMNDLGNQYVSSYTHPSIFLSICT